MAETAKESRFWSNFGKFSLVVGTLVALLTLFNRCGAEKTELQAEVERGNFYLPPRYETFSKAVEDALSSEHIETTLTEALDFVDPKPTAQADSAETTTERSDRLTYKISRDLSEKIGIREHLVQRPYRQYWHAKVRNVGTLPITQAALRMPGAAVAVIDREDLSRTEDDTGPTVEIGNIAAGETVQVTAWGDSSLIFIPGESDTSLYHAEGSGSVRYTNEASLLMILSKYLGYIISALFAMLIAFFVGMGHALKSTSAKNEAP